MSAETHTAQEAFDLAVGGVLRQGRVCVNGSGDCVYRGIDSLKCAAGFVFTDEEVEGLNDGVSAWEIITYRAERLEPHGNLLDDLQRVHDGSLVADWPTAFRDLALAHDLSTAVIDQWEAEQAGGEA